jgi:hypothetical protein
VAEECRNLESAVAAASGSPAQTKEVWKLEISNDETLHSNYGKLGSPTLSSVGEPKGSKIRLRAISWLVFQEAKNMNTDSETLQQSLEK